MAKRDKNLKGVLHSYAIPRFLFVYAKRRKTNCAYERMEKINIC